MFAFRRILVSVAFLVCLGTFALAQQQDEIAASRVFGPRWKVLAHASGMVFAGKVLEVETLPATGEQTIPMIQLKFRVEHAIAGVQPGRVVTIREWAGAWTTHRAMRPGQHMLLFFYPPSGLGLTSPVGGPLGQIELDPSGNNPVPTRQVGANRGSYHVAPPLGTVRQASINWRQLQRAIQSAREE